MGTRVLNVGMIDADLLDNGTKHPNLAQMKMSAYCKSRGHNVKLVLDENYDDYDILIVSQVFNYTKLPEKVQSIINQLNCSSLEELNTSIVEEISALENGVKVGPICSIGGTGFFPNGGRNLDDVIEHIMPDYHLYDDFVDMKELEGWNRTYYSDYLEYSIGFTTRGCFRKCSFCVNKKYDRAMKHSPVSEFMDVTRPKIYLWDDNILAFSGWESIIRELNATGKPFQFRQGIDIRLLTDKRAKVLAECRYHGDYIFAFDHIEDKEIITKRLHNWRKYCNKTTKLYVLCAYDPNVWQEKWRNTHLLETMDEAQIKQFELQDVVNTFERIKILMRYGCHPYIMRYQSYNDSHFRDIYIQLARWCNQPEFYKKKSFREYCIANQRIVKTEGRISAPYKAMTTFEAEYPEIAAKYFDLKYENENEYKTIVSYGRSPLPCPICVEETITWQDIIDDKALIKSVLKYYYGRRLDITCLSKCKKRCNADAEVASRKLVKIITETDYETIIKIIDESDMSVLDSNLIPQPGDFKTLTEDLLHVIGDGQKYSFLELGKQLREPGKSNGAYTKFGESYGKYAALLDIATLTDDKPTSVQISPIGKVILNVSDYSRNDFFIKETLRIPIVQVLLRDSRNHNISITDYLTPIFTGPTIDRRLTAVKFFLNTIRGYNDIIDSRLDNIDD